MPGASSGLIWRVMISAVFAGNLRAPLSAAS